MSRMLKLFCFLISYNSVKACAGGNTANSMIFTNPSFMLNFNPPAAWTFPGGSPQTDLNYFPSQPLTQTEANSNAIGALSSAMLSALSESNIDTVGFTITPTYTAPQVSDCSKSTTGPMVAVGGQIGIYQAGAITQLGTVTGTAITAGETCADLGYLMTAMLTYTPFIQTASIKVTGLTASGFQLEQVANALQAILNFNNHVIFTQEVTFS